MWSPFRAAGVVSDGAAPAVCYTLGGETFVACPAGDTFQVLDAARLRLKMVGPRLGAPSSCLAARSEWVFAATGGSGGEIVSCHRGEIVARHRGHGAGGAAALLCLGPNLLLSAGRDGFLRLHSTPDKPAPGVRRRAARAEEPQAEMHLGAGFVPTCLAHPPTYLNKVLVGGADGSMQLWNVATQRQLYAYSAEALGNPTGAAIRAIEPAPALDVVALAFADGGVALHDVRADRAVARFEHSAAGRSSAMGGAAVSAGASAAGVASLAFRVARGGAQLCAGGADGRITVWDLERKQLAGVVRSAHEGAITTMAALRSGPLLLTCGGDNALREWAFEADMESAEDGGAARLLRHRSGHAAPPTVLAYYGDEGRTLLSAGDDRTLRAFSTFQDHQSRELSQGRTASRARRLQVSEAELKLPPVTCMAANMMREPDWANVVTAHRGATSAYTWRTATLAVGEHVLTPPGKRLYPITAVSLSACGNYALVGTEGGRVDRFNMQSGIHRGEYEDRRLGSAHLAHSGGVVVGAHSCCANRLMVSAAVVADGNKGEVKVWAFRSRRLRALVPLPAAPVRTSFHGASRLLAVACADFVVRLVDAAAPRVVRVFRGHGDRPTALCISRDARWVLSAAMDSTVRVWDVQAASCRDVMRLAAPAVALSLSPNGTTLATAHSEQRAIYLWANADMYGGVSDKQLQGRRAALPRIGNAGEDEDSEDEDAEALVSGWARTDGVDVGDEDTDMDESDDDEDGAEGESPGGAQRASAAARSRGGQAVGEADDEATLDGRAILERAAAELEAANAAPGGPAPLSERSITLGLLPKAQWQGLVRLDEIRARAKPTEAPAKPESMPFFLPSVKDLEMETGGAKDRETVSFFTGQRNEGAGSGSGDGAGEADGEADRGAKRVRRHAPSDDGAPRLLELTRACEEEGDAGALETALVELRGMSPSALDAALRELDIIGDAGATRAALLAVLHFIRREVERGANFELMQALLARILAIHAEALGGDADLREACGELHAAQKEAAARMSELMDGVLAMAGFFTAS